MSILLNVIVFVLMMFWIKCRKYFLDTKLSCPAYGQDCAFFDIERAADARYDQEEKTGQGKKTKLPVFSYFHIYG